jgi:hypothetical protein
MKGLLINNPFPIVQQDDDGDRHRQFIFSPLDMPIESCPNQGFRVPNNWPSNDWYSLVIPSVQIAQKMRSCAMTSASGKECHAGFA